MTKKQMELILLLLDFRKSDVLFWCNPQRTASVYWSGSRGVVRFLNTKEERAWISIDSADLLIQEISLL